MGTLLVGQPAPDFKAKAVVKGKIVDDFHLSQFHGKYVVLFFYPLDFTFVCPTELHAFQEKMEEFEKRNAIPMACSVDSWYSHLSRSILIWRPRRSVRLLNTAAPRVLSWVSSITFPIWHRVCPTVFQ